MKDKLKYSLILSAGLLAGIFIFLPVNELTSFYEYRPSEDITVWQFISNQLVRALTLQTPVKFFFYLTFGGLMGIIFLLSLKALRKRNSLIFQLEKELEKNLPVLLKNKEDDTLEFKSSFRFDYKQLKVNKALESVITKTLAGFMNTRGGSLLIGVSDSGSILGLESDFNTLNRKDSDGYTQLITSTVAERLGTPACRLLKILFHRHDDKEVCRIIVLPSPIPVYVSEANQTHFYIRTGSGTREMDVQEAITFIKTKWG